MLEKSQEYLRLALAAAAILIGLSVAYHYVIYIPEKDRARDLEIRSKADHDALQLKERQAADSKLAMDRRTNYRICLSNAQEDYHQRWEASCRVRSGAADKSRSQCIANGLTESYCGNSYPPLAASHCELPQSVSENYDSMLKEDRKRCLDEAKSGVLASEQGALNLSE